MINKDLLRNEIDNIDHQIITFFEKRLNISLQIGLDKLNNGIALYDRERETILISKLKDISKNKLSESYIKNVYTQILEETRKHIINVYNQYKEQKGGFYG